MARHVDKADDPSAWARPIGKAQINRDPPCLFLLQPVGIHASETTHERCFAVVDVACRADDHSATSSIPNGRPDRGSWRSVDMQARVIEATTPCSVTAARAICATAT